ncbi:hypothetical protein EVAR_20463_1 [Eumeta japonica]|uniref:Uncharacterized protein n=1 Tax=Eumeta variegata TaxID=151549 RepID=A0A4C1TXZ7_EUMVA|nr:hypothetical protein EVAR_20463_1 [Eumeta japonica]
MLEVSLRNRIRRRIIIIDITQSITNAEVEETIIDGEEVSSMASSNWTSIVRQISTRWTGGPGLYTGALSTQSLLSSMSEGFGPKAWSISTQCGLGTANDRCHQCGDSNNLTRSPR